MSEYHFTSNQKAIAIAPKFTSIASVFGSAFIISEIIKDRAKLQTTFHRILLGMCVADCLSSIWFFLGTWPIPRGTEGVFMAVGNTGSCVAQGFFSQLSITTAYYNASLSMFYLLKIGKGWSNGRIQRKVEPVLLLVPVCIGLGTSFAGVALGLYNNEDWKCWIAPQPRDCKETWKYGDEGNCQRGDNASLYRLIFYYSFLWLAILTVTINMILVYRSVLKKEVAVDRHCTLPEGEEHGRRLSRKVLIQGYWYCGAFYATWIFPTITRITQAILGSDTPFGLIVLAAMFVPIQGAFNFVVYLRPRYKSYPTLVRISSCFKRRQVKADDDQLDSTRTMSVSRRFSAIFYSGSETNAHAEIQKEHVVDEDSNAGAKAPDVV